MALCKKKVSKNLDRDCNLTGGVKARLHVYNRADWVVVRNATNPQIIEDLTPVTPGLKGLIYEGFNQSVKPKANLVVKTYSEKYDHLVDFVVLSRGSETKSELEALNDVFTIVENNYQGSDATFEIHGLDVGLVKKSLSDDPSNADNEGAYVLQLGSPDDFKEAHLPATFFKTDIAATRVLLLATVTPSV